MTGALCPLCDCWGSRLRVADTKRHNKLICKAIDIADIELNSLMAVSEKRMLSKLQAIRDIKGDDYHPNSRSFLPVSIMLYNSSL